MTGILIKKGKLGHRRACRGKMPREDGSLAAGNQETVGIKEGGLEELLL